MAVVVFSYPQFAARYPEIAGSIAAPTAQLFFDEAMLYCDNTDCSPIADVTTRAMLLNMLTAHIAKLGAYLNGQAPRELVGRIASAGEGSVSVSAEMNYPPGSAQWFMQTTYGAAFWQATTRYRMGQFMAGSQFDPDPYGSFVAFGGVQ